MSSGELSDEERRFIDENFENYGSGWSDEGLAGIERDFHIRARVKWRKYVLELSMRSPAGFCSTMTITKGDGGLSSSGIRIPEGEELTAEELSRVEDALRHEGSVILQEPNNGTLSRLDLRGGTQSLLKGPLDLSTCIGEDGKPEISPPRKLLTRRRGDLACLYFVQDKGWQEPFCLWLRMGGDTVQVEGACWGDVPAPKGGILSRATFEFVDTAMKENGDFGVYGSVAGGLDDLMRFMQVDMRLDEGDEERGSSWAVSCSPLDGHGHFLNFQIDAKTGGIDGCMAGHLVPEPDFAFEDTDPE